MTRVGRILKDQRKQAGLTIAELARQTGMSHSLISKVEAGVMPCSAEKLDQMARCLGGDTRQLLFAARRLPPDVNRTITRNRQLFDKVCDLAQSVEA